MPHDQLPKSVSARNFRIVSGTIVCALSVLAIAVILVAIARGSVGVSQRQCFIVDMLENRVPNWQMPLHRQPNGHMHGTSPPLAFGEVCFDKQQLVVDWKIRQSFSRLYTLRDLMLRGPLRKKETVAPSVLTLGVQISETGKLHGSTIVDKHLIAKILEHPTQYYVSLEGDYEKFEPTSEGSKVREIARHNLNYGI
jgi:hypothetical protein